MSCSKLSSLLLLASFFPAALCAPIAAPPQTSPISTAWKWPVIPWYEYNEKNDSEAFGHLGVDVWGTCLEILVLHHSFSMLRHDMQLVCEQVASGEGPLLGGLGKDSEEHILYGHDIRNVQLIKTLTDADSYCSAYHECISYAKAVTGKDDVVSVVPGLCSPLLPITEGFELCMGKVEPVVRNDTRFQRTKDRVESPALASSLKSRCWTSHDERHGATDIDVFNNDPCVDPPYTWDLKMPRTLGTESGSSMITIANHADFKTASIVSSSISASLLPPTGFSTFRRSMPRVESTASAFTSGTSTQAHTTESHTLTSESGMLATKTEVPPPPTTFPRMPLPTGVVPNVPDTPTSDNESDNAAELDKGHICATNTLNHDPSCPNPPLASFGPDPAGSSVSAMSQPAHHGPPSATKTTKTTKISTGKTSEKLSKRHICATNTLNPDPLCPNPSPVASEPSTTPDSKIRAASRLSRRGPAFLPPPLFPSYSRFDGMQHEQNAQSSSIKRDSPITLVISNGQTSPQETMLSDGGPEMSTEKFHGSSPVLVQTLKSLSEEVSSTKSHDKPSTSPDLAKSSTILANDCPSIASGNQMNPSHDMIAYCHKLDGHKIQELDNISASLQAPAAPGHEGHQLDVTPPNLHAAPTPVKAEDTYTPPTPAGFEEAHHTHTRYYTWPIDWKNNPPIVPFFGPPGDQPRFKDPRLGGNYKQ